MSDSTQHSMGERKQLELALREWLDDDDAVTCAQEMLERGWLPPSEVATVQSALDELRACGSPFAYLRDAEQRVKNLEEQLESHDLALSRADRLRQAALSVGRWGWAYHDDLAQAVIAYEEVRGTSSPAAAAPRSYDGCCD